MSERDDKQNRFLRKRFPFLCRAGSGAANEIAGSLTAQLSRAFLPKAPERLDPAVEARIRVLIEEELTAYTKQLPQLVRVCLGGKP